MTRQVLSPQPEMAEILPLRGAERRRLLPFSPSWLYQKAALGEVELLKVGGRTFIRRSEIERIVQDAPRVGGRQSRETA